MYFKIMNASSGGIEIEYLEKQPFVKIAWLSRLAEASDVRRYLDLIYAINTGYAGDQKKLDGLHHRLERLLLDEPKRDVGKIKKWKSIQKAKGKAAKKKKKRKRVKLNLKDK